VRPKDGTSEVEKMLGWEFNHREQANIHQLLLSKAFITVVEEGYSHQVIIERTHNYHNKALLCFI
jgi:hypothetical protein